MWNQWQLLRKQPEKKSPEFLFTLGWKLAPKMAIEVHVVRIFASSSNEHIKQDCESIRNFLNKIVETWILIHF